MKLGHDKTPWNPSRTATKRVKDPLPIPSECNMCGGNVRIATHDEIYGMDYGDWPWVYFCDACGSYVGMHSSTNIPLGTLADKETRCARSDCKKPFNDLWKKGFMTRTEAYKWLAEKLNIPISKCHFGFFTAQMCNQAKEICITYQPKRLTPVSNKRTNQ